MLEDDDAGLLYVGADVFPAEVLPVAVLRLIEDVLEEVLLDTVELLPALLLVPIPFLTEVPLLTEVTLLLLPDWLPVDCLIPVPSVCARNPWNLFLLPSGLVTMCPGW